MTLKDFDLFNSVTIQTHDNPDPDALASAFGLYKYFKTKGKDVEIVYSGRNKIQKANLMLMIQECGIPIKYVKDIEYQPKELLITVDCQYGEGNVTTLKANKVAIIDHHQGLGKADYQEICPYLGSCSTLVWSLLVKEGINVKEDILLGTAFYYGLMTDTSGFMELNHPLDRDLMDSVEHSKALIKLFSNSNISLEELEIAGQALLHYDFDADNNCSIIRAKPCDPNILGFINDLALQVDEILVSIVYNEMISGYKLSVRSCTIEVKANELADYITSDIGSGGGHIEKAGGYIDKSMFKQKYGENKDIDEYLNEIIADYYKNSEIIYAKDYHQDTSDMKTYSKKKIPLGYVDLSNIMENGTNITVRTLEGDVDMKVDGSFYIMIGLKGEVYPISKEKFEKSYDRVDGPYVFEGEYEPTIHDKYHGVVINLIEHAKVCINSGKNKIYAKELDKMVKIFTLWDSEKYYLGKPGDFIACRLDDDSDVYIIEHDIFYKTYEPAD